MEEFKKEKEHVCQCKNGCANGGPCCGRCHHHTEEGSETGKTTVKLEPLAPSTNALPKAQQVGLGFGSDK